MFIIKKSLSFPTTAIFNIALYIVLESQIAKRRIQVQATIASEKCDKLEENILKEKIKIKTLEEELQREATRSGRQTLELHERINDLVIRLHSTVQMNEHLRENRRMTEIEIRRLKKLIQQNENLKAKENENQLSVQSMGALDTLRPSDASISTSRNSEKENKLMENLNQLQTQPLIEHENVFRLEVQLREQQSARETLEASIPEAASTAKTETDLNGAEPKMRNTDINVNELNVMVPLSSSDSADISLEGML